MSRITLYLTCVSAMALLAPLGASAGPYVPQGPFVIPLPPCGECVPPPPRVPGKEYSNHLDRRGFLVDPGDPGAPHSPDPEQNIAWDGIGGTADTFDYSLSRANQGDTVDREVDALANQRDVLYREVVANRTPLAFSTDLDPKIWYETVSGSSGIWAPALAVDQRSPDDVDGLEVWGREPEAPVDAPTASDDANRYSLEFDPAIPGGARISVWHYDPTFHVSTPYLTAAAIAGAIGRTDLAPQIDLDAMMNLDESGEADTADAGDRILFSIDPIDVFDGGEIWEWTVGGPPAAFLSHGGHLWDTAFPVMATFGTATENINALEAIPEPGSLVLMLLGAACMLGSRRRRDGRA